MKKLIIILQMAERWASRSMFPKNWFGSFYPSDAAYQCSSKVFCIQIFCRHAQGIWQSLRPCSQWDERKSAEWRHVYFLQSTKNAREDSLLGTWWFCCLLQTIGAWSIWTSTSNFWRINFHFGSNTFTHLARHCSFIGEEEKAISFCGIMWIILVITSLVKLSMIIGFTGIFVSCQKTQKSTQKKWSFSKLRTPD